MENGGNREIRENRSVWLVTNAASGSNSEESVQRLRDCLVRNGLAPERVVALPREDLPDRQALERARVAVLVTFTGDGTANAQVARLGDWQGDVLVLPGGTQNLLARRLHGDQARDPAGNPETDRDAQIARIVADFARGRLVSRHLSVIRSEHGDALCEIVAGPGATWSDVRETMRDRDVPAMAATLAEAIRQSAGGPMVCLSDPVLGKAEGYPALRLSPQASAIAVAGYGAQGLADYARQGVAILRRDFRQGPHEDLGRHRSVACRSSGAIELMIDGERVTGHTSERFVLATCPVQFLATLESDSC